MSPERPRTVLVTGANGYIGRAVAEAFQRAGYTTYGLIRSSNAAKQLEDKSIIPIVGSAADGEHVLSAITARTDTLDVIATTTEDTQNYVPHFQDTLAMLHFLAKTSSDHGVRPLVLFTSGSKDYGRMGLHGSPGLQPQTEEAPVRPPPFLATRAEKAVEVLKEESFDAMVLRPTHVHGYSSSYYGRFFELAAEAKRNHEALQFRADPRTILHSMHVDDCGEAYVALANHPDRTEVSGQCFNLSAGRRYETLEDIAQALVGLYGIEKGVEFDLPAPEHIESADPLITFSQWVSSEKLRRLTGWREQRPMFAEAIARYKEECDAAVQNEDAAVARVRQRDLHNVAKKEAKAAGLFVDD